MRAEAVKAVAKGLMTLAVATFAFAVGAQQAASPVSPVPSPAKQGKATSAPAPQPGSQSKLAALAEAAAPAPKAVAQPQPKGQVNDQDSMDAINGRVHATKKAMEELEVQIGERSKRLQEMFNGYNKAERNLTGFNGLGQVEQMELKAELYGGERMARKKLGEEFGALSASIEQWAALKAKQKENLRLLALKVQILELRKDKDSKESQPTSKEAAASKLADIEYYQVKKDADLRTISSYPEVYGTPEFWDYLYKANKDQLLDPDKPVPAGTTLVVPQDVKKLPDFNDI